MPLVPPKTAANIHRPRQDEGLGSPVLTIKEIAEFLRVHPSTIYRLIKRREMPVFRVGSDWRITQYALEKWLRQAEKRP